MLDLFLHKVGNGFVHKTAVESLSCPSAVAGFAAWRRRASFYFMANYRHFSGVQTGNSKRLHCARRSFQIRYGLSCTKIHIGTLCLTCDFRCRSMPFGHWMLHLWGQRRCSWAHFQETQDLYTAKHQICCTHVILLAKPHRNWLGSWVLSREVLNSPAATFNQVLRAIYHIQLPNHTWKRGENCNKHPISQLDCNWSTILPWLGSFMYSNKECLFDL